jgi:dihydroneopterin aldolase/D-erythro-7,8-dihydroneopterin triphosphate epimerase
MDKIIMDKIIIRDLSVRCIIGINEEERRVKQDVVINVVMNADLSAPGRTDSFGDAVDYRAVKKRIYDMASASSCNLIEALAEKTADLCLEDKGVQSVCVTIDKPGALRFARSVAVEITRNRRS